MEKVLFARLQCVVRLEPPPHATAFLYRGQPGSNQCRFQGTVSYLLSNDFLDLRHSLGNKIRLDDKHWD